MSPYLAIIGARFRLLFQYRAAAFAGICTQFFWGFLHVMIFTAFYAQLPSSVAVPISLEQTITYVWLVQAFLLLLPWNIDRDVEQLVRSGNVAYELLRPIDLYGLWFARAFAWRCTPLPLRVVPILVLAYVFFDMQGPASILSTWLFLVSMICSLLLGTAITALMMVSLFWTVSSHGVVRVVTGLVVALSGMQVPLPLFPDWAKPFVYALPFRGLMDTPFRIYLGHIAPDGSLFPILHQLLWSFVLIVLGRWLLVRIQRRIVLQGG